MRYLVNETLAGNAHRLKGYTLGIEVFKRGSDFDPAIDAIVRVEVGRLRLKLDEYYRSYGLTDAILIELPKGSYIPNFSSHEVLNQSNHLHQNGVDVWPSIIKDIPSLVVIPFVNLSAEPGQNYFSGGLVDNLIYELSKLSGLFIISRQSSFCYRDSLKASSEIGKELGVMYLLEESVQRSCQLVRVTVNLLDSNTGGHIWSERYESELQEIFVMQDIIVQNIVKALQIKLASSEAELFGHEGTESI